MRNLYVVILVMLSFWAKAQTDFHAIDSLEDAAKRQEGEEKIRTLLSLSKEMRTLSFDDGVAVLEEAKEEAQRIGNKSLISRTNLDLAEAYIDNYDFDLAEPCLRRTLASCGSDDEDLVCGACTKIGYIHLKTGNLDTAAYYYEKSLKVAQSSGDKSAYANAVHNLAVISRDKGNREAAMKGFEEAVEIYYEINDSLSAARNLSDIALLYLADNQYEESYNRLSVLMPFFEKKGEYNDLARSYSNLGLISLSTVADADTALLLFDKARHYAVLANDSLKMVDIMLNESDLYLIKGQIDSAFLNLEETERISSRLSYYEGLTATYVRLSEAYYIIDDFVKSKEYFWLCSKTEQKIGANLYTPLLKPYLMRCYAHLKEYDSIALQTQWYEQDYNELLAEKMELEQDMEDMALLEESKDALEAENVRLRYVVAGLVTLLVVLAVYTLVSGRSRKEK